MSRGIHFLLTQRLAVGAITSDFGAGEKNLETEMRFNLAAEPLQGITEILFDLAAAQANDVRVLLLHAGFVIVLVARPMHKIELVHKAGFLQHFQRPVDGDAIDLGVLLLREGVKTFGVEVQSGLIDEFQQDSPLARETYSPIFQQASNTSPLHVPFEGATGTF